MFNKLCLDTLNEFLKFLKGVYSLKVNIEAMNSPANKTEKWASIHGNSSCAPGISILIKSTVTFSFCLVFFSHRYNAVMLSQNCLYTVYIIAMISEKFGKVSLIVSIFVKFLTGKKFAKPDAEKNAQNWSIFEYPIQERQILFSWGLITYCIQDL